MQNTKLKTKLAAVNLAFSTPAILQRQSSDTKQIANYYRKNRLAYKLFNSREGFVHMGMSSNGSFSTEDFYEQARIVNQAIQKAEATNVLELAAGKGATIEYLAKQNPKVAFTGMDLPNGQLKAGHVKPNVNLLYGDYHDLGQFKANSFDVVYVIEALCHATNKAKVIAEVHRVLRKGGLFVVIDGYFKSDPTTLSDSERIASQLVAKSMMVTDKNQGYKEFIGLIKKSGLEVVEKQDFSKSILPSLYRLEHTARKLVEHPRLAKVTTKLVGELVTANAVAGYLMPVCVEDNLFEYRYTLVKKIS